MQVWLNEHDIRWAADMLKSEVYELVKNNNPEPEYICDRMVLEQGFVVVRLPPYHGIFNPIELIWAWIKGKMAKEKRTFKIADVMTLTNEAISAVTADHWRSACLRCKKLVDEFWKTDSLQEEAVGQLVIELNGNDDDDNDDGDDVFIE